MKYPDECLAFEVKRTGKHFDGRPYFLWSESSTKAAFARTEREHEVIVDSTTNGLSGYYFAHEVRPLTRAARALMRIVK